MTANVRDEVAELIAMYDDGGHTFASLMSHLADLTKHFAVADIVDALPERWRVEYASWLTELLDNDIPPEQYIYIRAEGPLPDASDHIATAKLQAWFRTRRRTGPE